MVFLVMLSCFLEDKERVAIGEQERGVIRRNVEDRAGLWRGR